MTKSSFALEYVYRTSHTPYDEDRMNRSFSQPTDEFLESLSVPQLVAVAKAHRPTENQIDSVLILNRVTARLFDLIGEDKTERLVYGT